MSVNTLTYPMPSVKLLVEGKRVALVREIREKVSSKTAAVAGFGDSAPSGFSYGSTCFELTFEHVPANDGVSVKVLDNFDLKVIRDGAVTDYGRCICTKTESLIKPGEPIVETVTVMAKRRTV